MSAMTLDVSGTAKTPFHRLVRVELRKSYDTRASFWLLVVIGLIVLATEVIVLIVTTVNDEAMQFGDFIGAAAFMTSFLLPVLGIMLVTSEWGQRTAMVTFALEPRRSTVIAAKAVVGVLLTLLTVAVAIVIGLVCNLIYGGIEGGADWTFGWTGFFAFIVNNSFAMLGGFALASLLLNTAAAIVAFFVYQWVLPILIGIGAALVDFIDRIAPWIDFLSAQGELYELPMTGEQWAHLAVAAFIWVVVPTAIGVRRILRAEVK